MHGNNGIPIVTSPRWVGNTVIFEKNRIGKNIFFEHEAKNQKFVSYYLRIGPSGYAAQFLDHLVHFGHTLLFGEKKSTKFSKITQNLQWKFL